MYHQKNARNTSASDAEPISHNTQNGTEKNSLRGNSFSVGRGKLALGLWLIFAACAAASSASPQAIVPNLNLNLDLNKVPEIPGQVIRDGRDIGRGIASPKEGCDPTPTQGDNCHGQCMVVQKNCPTPVGYGISCGSDGWFRNKFCAYDLNGWCSGNKVAHACEQDKRPVNRVIPRTSNNRPRYY